MQEFGDAPYTGDQPENESGKDLFANGREKETSAVGKENDVVPSEPLDGPAANIQDGSVPAEQPADARPQGGYASPAANIQDGSAPAEQPADARPQGGYASPAANVQDGHAPAGYPKGMGDAVSQTGGYTPPPGSAAPQGGSYRPPQGGYVQQLGQQPYAGGTVPPGGYTGAPYTGGDPYGGFGGQGASYTPGGGYATAQPYTVNQSEPPIQLAQVEQHKSEPVPNKGLRVFCAVLAGVILLCAVAAGGYFAGRSSRGSSGGGTHAAVDLASKPEGTITDEENQNATYVFNAVKPSVVGIEVYSEQDTSSRSQASGVIYTEDGYIITNDHIYADIPDPKFLILMADGSEHEAAYVAGDSRSDLAVLKVEADGLPAATFGNSDELEVGEPVIAIGNPGGQTLAFSATQGVVSAVDRRIANASNYSMKFIQTDTAINPGNSGGALVNMYGQVVGITSWKYVGESYERIGFAIPTTIMKQVADSLIENKYVAGRARLGITYQAIDAVSARLSGLPQGLQVASVTDDSDLKGKVQKGDVLTHINDTAITDGSEVLEVLENAAPGDTVTFTVYTSGGQEATVSAVLLEDRGSSSYTLQSDEEELPDTNSGFDFPFGD